MTDAAVLENPANQKPHSSRQLYAASKRSKPVLQDATSDASRLTFNSLLLIIMLNININGTLFIYLR